MEPIVLNWSSGKDAALAYYYLQKSGVYQVNGLLTTLSAAYKRVSMHGVPEEVLDMQAGQMRQDLHKIYLPESAGMEIYNALMREAVETIRNKGIRHLAFGDLFLEDLRRYREEQLAAENFRAVFPLWKKNTHALVEEIEDVGIRAMIICVDERFLGKEFLGKPIDRQLLELLPAGVDPCGENGEFHTLVTDAPFFREPLAIEKGDIVHNSDKGNQQMELDTGFWFLDVRKGC